MQGITSGSQNDEITKSYHTCYHKSIVSSKIGVFEYTHIIEYKLSLFGSVCYYKCMLYLHEYAFLF